ncbi:MAG: CDP-alcohol phosphatidyltransferase family protein [Lachnospiraceae bacterium]|nr:CDP-alcohol phosphatidyltransferase family protein [Lachnospiraceae bacterium]
MIGFYNYTVILTYLSAVSSVMGMTFVMNGNIREAMFCLMFSGAFDLFDGKIARTKKNRTEREKVFGIQIDSLCDIVCFCMFPAMINFYISNKTCKIFSMISSSAIVVAGIIRLGYFNVMEQERQQQTNENRKSYQGLPVTSVAVILPVMYLIKPLINISTDAYNILFSTIILLVSLFFITDFKVKKPNNKEVIFLLLFAILIILGILLL